MDFRHVSMPRVLSYCVLADEICWGPSLSHMNEKYPTSNVKKQVHVSLPVYTFRTSCADVHPIPLDRWTLTGAWRPSANQRQEKTRMVAGDGSPLKVFSSGLHHGITK